MWKIYTYCDKLKTCVDNNGLKLQIDGYIHVTLWTEVINDLDMGNYRVVECGIIGCHSVIEIQLAEEHVNKTTKVILKNLTDRKC